jgi:hypothetical protein
MQCLLRNAQFYINMTTDSNPIRDSTDVTFPVEPEPPPVDLQAIVDAAFPFVNEVEGNAPIEVWGNAGEGVGN